MTSVALSTAIFAEFDAVVDVLRCALNCAMAAGPEVPVHAELLDAAVGRLSIGLVERLVEEETNR